MSKRKKTSSSSSNRGSVEIIKLNVSGERMSTTLATLTAFPNTVLGRKFQYFMDSESKYGRPLMDEDNAVFIDSDPQAFRVILNYLRRKRFVEGHGLSTSIRNTVQADADYFGLETLVAECQKVADELQAEHNNEMSGVPDRLEDIYSAIESSTKHLEHLENLEDIKNTIENLQGDVEGVRESMNSIDSCISEYMPHLT